MEKSKGKSWVEKVLNFELEDIEWDSESEVSIPGFKGQKNKVVVG